MSSVQIKHTQALNRKWAEDNEVQNCMACGKGFSVTVRRVGVFYSVSMGIFCFIVFKLLNGIQTSENGLNSAVILKTSQNTGIV